MLCYIASESAPIQFRVDTDNLHFFYLVTKFSYLLSLVSETVCVRILNDNNNLAFFKQYTYYHSQMFSGQLMSRGPFNFTKMTQLKNRRTLTLPVLNLLTWVPSHICLQCLQPGQCICSKNVRWSLEGAKTYRAQKPLKSRYIYFRYLNKEHRTSVSANKNAPMTVKWTKFFISPLTHMHNHWSWSE